MFTIISNIHKLNLSSDERIELYRKIEAYMGSKKGVMPGIKVSFRDICFNDLLKNPM